MKICFRLLLPLSLLMFSGILFAHDRPSPTAPGTYRNWGGEIDKLEIVAPFRLADYDRIVIEPFDTSSTPLPGEKDSTYTLVRDLLPHATTPFVEGLSDLLPKVPAKVETLGKSSGAGALVIRSKVLTMDPGSQARRYSANDPGRSRTVIAGEVVDGGTGKTLLRFRQERRFDSSSEIAVGGRPRAPQMYVNYRLKPLPGSGDSKRALGINLRLIGRDLGDVLRSF
jgi:hypothetical protein